MSMNYYKHHIGDYAKKTGHLSLLEHGAYLLMLHTYYGTEKPLPVGEPLYRIVRAQTKAERAAVDSIAVQFWEKTPVGLVNGRAFEEIEEAAHLIDVARTNGTHGGRPKKPSGFQKDNPAGFISEPSGKAIQIPDSNLQSPVRTTPPNPLTTEGAPRQRRSEHRRQTDAAREVWNQVISPTPPPRTPRIQAALDAIGGFQRVRMRSGDDEARIRREFCEAYAGEGGQNDN